MLFDGKADKTYTNLRPRFDWQWVLWFDRVSAIMGEVWSKQGLYHLFGMSQFEMTKNIDILISAGVSGAPKSMPFYLVKAR